MNPVTPETTKLGFIGIGYMGRPMAQRLLEAGFAFELPTVGVALAAELSS